MTVLSAETSFPRGRRPREKRDDKSSPQKRKFQTEGNDFLFGEQKNVKQSKKKIKKSESDVANQSIGNYALPIGGGHVRLGGKNGKEAIIESLSFQKLAKGTKLLGIVREVNDDFCLVSLPNMLTGYVLPSRKESSSDIPLKKQLCVGQILAVKVLKTATDKVGKGEKQVTRRRVQLSVEPSDINATGELSRHEVLRGRIISLEDHGVIIDLGDGRKGFCKFSNVEGTYETEETEKDDYAIDTGKRLLNEGRVHDFIIDEQANMNSSNVVSLALPSEQTLAKRALPSTYHPTLQDLQPGSLVRAKVEAFAKNGILVSFATIFRGSISSSHFGANWIPSNKSENTEEWKSVFDENTRTLMARIIAVDARTKVIRLSIQPHLLNLSQAEKLPPPGTVIENATVIRLDHNIGALLSLPLLEKLPSNLQPSLARHNSFVEASKRQAVYVHISKASSSRTSEDLFNKNYAPSTKHKVRILSTTHLVDGVATGATATEMVDAHILNYEDLRPGKVFRNVPVCKTMSGGSVMVDFGLGVRGIIPSLHLFEKSNVTSDYRTKLKNEKFKIAKKVDVRVLTVDTKTKRCFVTAKPSVVKAQDCLSNYSTIKVGQRGTGFISKIDSKAVYVTFFNKVYGRVTARSLAAELGVEEHQTDYNVGDVVTCRVISCRKRVGKNLDKYVDTESEEVEDSRNCGFWDLNLSLHVNDVEGSDDEFGIEKAKKMSQIIELRAGAVLPSKSMKVVELIPSIDKKRENGFIPGHAIVRVKSKYMTKTEDVTALPFIECKVPFDQILDSYSNEAITTKKDMDDFAKTHLVVGKKIEQKGLLLYYDRKKSSYEYSSAVGKLPIISLRPSLIQNADRSNEQGNVKATKVLIPACDTNLYIGAFVQGYIHEVNSRHGAFVHFLDGMVGLIPKLKKGLSLSKWETVTCKIEALDVTCRPPKILLRRSSPVREDASEKEAENKCTIKPGDKVAKVEVLDINFSRVNVKVLDKDFAFNSKIRVRLHVTMTESATLESVRRHPLPNEETLLEQITKGHPFYNWKKGKILENLTCVETHVLEGITFIELSNLKQDTNKNANSSLFETSVELKHGMQLSCVVVGFANSRRGLWVKPSPGLTCLVPTLELCDDIQVLNNLPRYFKIGDRINCAIMNKKEWQKNKSWGLRIPKLKTDERSNSSKINDPPLLSLRLALNGSGSIEIQKPKRGESIAGRINNAMRLYRPPSLMLEIRGGFRGRCCITELDEPDDWVNMPLGRQEQENFNEYKGIIELEESPLLHHGDGSELEGGNIQTESNIPGYEDGEYVQCRVLEGVASEPVVEVSLRASRLEGDLDDDELPEDNELVNAYVVNTNKKGCFLRLSRRVEGRVILKQLADGFLRDPIASFPMGRLVMGRVKATRGGKAKGKSKVSHNVDLDLRESQILEDEKKLQFEEIKSQGKYKGIITGIEEYGVFVRLDKSNVSGLVHKNECSDSKTKTVHELYDPGDLVKVLVIKKDYERKKLSLSMKASHFIGDDSSDDSSLEDSDGDAEMEDVSNENKDRGGDDSFDSEDENYVSKLAVKSRKEQEDSVDSDGDNEDSDSQEDDNDATSEDASDSSDESNTMPTMETDVGFNWGDNPVQEDQDSDDNSGDSSDEDSSDDDDEEVGKKGHSSRKRAAARRLEELQVSKREKALADGTADDNPETAADFERLLASDPNNSEKWIRYMAYYLSLADMDGCRRVAKRAFDRIDFRQEGEKLNVWTALLTMELKYGVDFDETITKACQQNNPKHVYLRACELLEKEISCSDNTKHAVERADNLHSKMCKKFRSKKKVWVAHLSYLLKQGRHQEAHALLKRALTSLPSYKHIETMSKLAQLEFEFGSIERARTVFSGVLAKYPKRLDLLFVFVDKEIKAGEIDVARSHLRKTAENPSNKLQDKQMKKLFRKWMKIEEEHGSKEQQEEVKDVARSYVERRNE